MEAHVFYAGLIVAGAIWALWVATDPVFDRTVQRNNELVDLLNEELAANQRLLTERRPAAVVMPPIVIMRADELDIV
jgi:hypothetical protein